MKKILIMIMSCNQEHFITEEQICKNTYLSRLPDNIDYIIYRGDYYNNEIVGNVLQLNCSAMMCLLAMAVYIVFCKRTYTSKVTVNGH